MLTYKEVKEEGKEEEEKEKEKEKGKEEGDGRAQKETSESPECEAKVEGRGDGTRDALIGTDEEGELDEEKEEDPFVIDGGQHDIVSFAVYCEKGRCDHFIVLWTG